MAKIDYTKVEKAFGESINKMKVRKLLKYADLASSLGLFGGVKEKDLTEKQKQEIMKTVLNNLESDMVALKKRDKRVFERLKIDTIEAQGLFTNPNDIRPDEWEKIKEIREKVIAYKKELKKKIANLTDEDIVKSQRKKQKTSRFNKDEDWLPLH